MALTISWAQNEPFNCDYNAYLFQYNDVYAIDLASGSAYNVASDITPGKSIRGFGATNFCARAAIR